MTCLGIVQGVCRRLGQPYPNAVVTSTDAQVLQFLSLLNWEGQELADRYEWSALQNEASFTTVAAEDQGEIETIAPGLKYILNGTIWNRTLRRPVFGPQTPQTWQQKKAFNIAGPWNNHRIRGGHLWMYPAPPAGQSCYFEYVTRNWATDSTGVTGNYAFTNDSDISLLDEELLILGLMWRWKMQKGFEFGPDSQLYDRRVMDSMARDGGKDWLNTANTRYDVMPGIIVPEGSWNLP